MNDLESQVRDSLDHRAGVVPTPSMPPGTVGRIRRRQAFVTGIVGAVLVAVMGVGLTLLRTPARIDPVEPGSLQAPRSVLEDVPPGWPTVDIHATSTAYDPAPVEYHAVDEITVVAAGTVEGHGFSFLAWTGSTEDDGTEGPCFLFAGPSPTASEEGKGGPVVATCADEQAAPVPEAADLYVLGQQEPSAEGIGANMGFVSPRVRSLEVVLDDGSRSPIPLVRGSDGWGGMRTFLFFPPARRTGTLIALDADHAVLARAPICSFEPGPGGSCAGDAEQLAPMPQVGG